jgi:hypothetical protein
MADFDKSLLFKSRLPEADVDVPGVGTVRVRGLSRAEVMGIRSDVKDEADAIKRIAWLERKLLAAALVDPVLTEAEVAEWQKASTAGEMEPVAHMVQVLSGTDDGAAKAAYKEFDADPATEFRLPPSTEAGHDGGPAAG